MRQCYHVAWNIDKKTETKNAKIAKTKNGRIMLLCQCAAYDSKNIKIYQTSS